MGDLDATFRAAADFLAKNGSSGDYSTDTKLKIYSLYKQATDGDQPPSVPQPSRMNFVARSKYDAWNELKGTSKEEAKKLYIQTIEKADPRFKAPKPAAAAAAPTTTTTTAVVPAPSAAIVPASAAAAPPRPRQQLPPTSSHHTPASERDVMLLAAIYGSLALMGIGVAGFLVSTLSTTALMFLGAVGVGIAGLVGAALVMFEENGLLGVLPGGIRTLLLDSTWLEFILDDTLFREVKVVVVQVLPMLVAGDEKTKLEALSLMTPATRRWLTQRGLVRSLPDGLRRLLLPRRVREQLERDAPTFRLQKEPISDPATFARLIAEKDPIVHTDALSKPGENVAAIAASDAAAAESAELDLDPSRRLFRSLVKEIVTKQNVQFAVNAINPHVMRAASAALALATVAQLAVSRESRQTLVSIARTLALVSSLLGSAGCGGLFVLWVAAKKKQRREGW